MAKADLQFVLSLTVSQFEKAVKQAEKAVSGMGQHVHGALKLVDNSFEGVIRSGQAYRRTMDDLNGTANHIRSTLLGLGSAIAGGMIFRKAARDAFGFNQTLEQSRIGIAALVRTFKDVDMAQSFAMAEEIQKRLQVAGLKTTATYEELLRALQEGIGPALRENFNPKQIVAFTSAMTQAAAALAMPMDQLGQELRAILDGTIDRNARIAKALQITNADVKNWKAAGTLFANLQDRLKAFAAAGDQAANTFAGAWSNMQDAIQMALGQGTQRTFAATTAAIKRLTGSIVTIDEQAGTFTFNKKLMAALDGIDQRISMFLDSLTADDIAAAIENIVRTAGAIIDVLGQFAGGVVMVTEALGPLAPAVAKAAGEFLLFTTVTKALGFVFLEPYRIIKGVIAAVAELKGLQIVSWLGGVRAAINAVAMSTSALSVAFKGFLALAAADAVMKIGRLVAILWDWKKATDELAEAKRRATEQKAWIDPQVAAKLREVNQALGTNYRTMDELFAAQKRGEVAYDELTGTWVRGAKKMTDATKAQATASRQATGKALEEMRRQYRKY
ncbi:MAG TPA: hypothetical protein ENI90_06250, partial [Methylothermaceae bacterium]|nr:hypothetical protein [Methylothermaceae bacterium]